MFPPKKPAIKDTWIANNCSKIIVDFGPKKWQTSRLIKKGYNPIGPDSFGPNLASPLNQNWSSDSFRFNLTIPLFMDVFFVAVFLFFVRLPYFDWKKCNFHHKNAISISGRYYIAIFEKQERKKNYSKQQKCYTTSLRILSPNTERIFCRLVLISVSTPPNLLFIETEIRMIHAKKSFLLKKVDFPLSQFTLPTQEKKSWN